VRGALLLAFVAVRLKEEAVPDAIIGPRFDESLVLEAILSL
jgi:hypothetical protein